MTATQKQLTRLLLTGHYMVPYKNHRGRKCWKVMDQEHRPVCYAYHLKDPLKRVLKTDKAGRITLNLSLVRQEHGKSFLKTQYKKRWQNAN